MHIHEDIMAMMARERVEDAVRFAERMRDLRLARAPRLPTRVRLGIALIRFGHWLMGQPSPTPGTPIGLEQARS